MPDGGLAYDLGLEGAKPKSGGLAAELGLEGAGRPPTPEQREAARTAELSEVAGQYGLAPESVIAANAPPQPTAPPPTPLESFGAKAGHGLGLFMSRAGQGMGAELAEAADPMTRLSRGTGGQPTGETAYSAAWRGRDAELAEHAKHNPGWSMAGEGVGAALAAAPVALSMAPAAPAAAYAAEAGLGAGIMSVGESRAQDPATMALEAAPDVVIAGTIGAALPMAGPHVAQGVNRALGRQVSDTARDQAMLNLSRHGGPVDVADDVGSIPERLGRWWAETSGEYRARGMSDEGGEEARLLTANTPEGQRYRAEAMAGEEGGRATELAEGVTGLERAVHATTDYAHVGHKGGPMQSRIEEGGTFATGYDELHPPPAGPDEAAMYSLERPTASYDPTEASELSLPVGRPRPAGPAKNEARAEASRRAWERRRESDDFIAAEFEGDHAALETWERVKRQIKPTEHASRLEVFQQYLHDNPADVRQAYRSIEDTSGYAQETPDAYRMRQDPETTRVDDLEALETGQASVDPALAGEAAREAGDSLGQLARTPPRRVAAPVADADPQLGTVRASLATLQDEFPPPVAPGRVGGKWADASEHVIGEAERLNAEISSLAKMRPGASVLSRRNAAAIEQYGAQVRDGLAEGGPDGTARAFIGLDRLKRAVGKGIDSKDQDIHAFSLESFMRIRQVLEDGSLWGNPAAFSQRAQNEAWVAKITADKAGYRGKFLRPSPTERRVERLDIEDVDDAQTKPLDVGDVELAQGLVNKLGTEGGTETKIYHGPMPEGQQRPVYGVTDVDRFKAGARSRADLAGTLAREHDAPPEIMAQADAAREFAYSLDETLDAATREQVARRALEGVESEHMPWTKADMATLGLTRKYIPGAGKTARSMAALERESARNAPPPMSTLEREAASLAPPRQSMAAPLRGAPGRHVSSASSPRGGMSISPADALAALEQDPNAFGPNSEAVRAAAERGDVQGIQMAMLAR